MTTPNGKVAIITGAGDRAFSTGNDLKMHAKRGVRQIPKGGFAGLTTRFDLDKPVIAAVNGIAMGGGFELALACDLVIAAENAFFALSEPRVGLSALAGGVQYLPRAIGLLILSLIPGLNLIATPLWLLFGVWMMAVQYIDYPCDNNKVSWDEMLAWLRAKRWQSLGFGGITYVALLIPFVNILMMPAAVAGATLFWVREDGAAGSVKAQ